MKIVEYLLYNQIKTGHCIGILTDYCIARIMNVNIFMIIDICFSLLGLCISTSHILCTLT